MLLMTVLGHLIRRGRLKLIDAHGRTHRACGTKPGPAVTIRLHDPALHRKLLINPQLKFGEAYMDGTLTVEEGDIATLLDLLMGNVGMGHGNWFYRLADTLRRIGRPFAQFNPISRARRNAAHHYDLSPELFQAFLDPDLQYSCAYFTAPGQALETAQANKKRHIAAKLLLKPGQRVLDIGSGWGGLSLGLARLGAGRVTGITLSKEQLDLSRELARKTALESRVDFQLKDYREIEGRFDRVVSVGMFEHVGVNHYDGFFRRLNQLLTDDGVALLHMIGRLDTPGATNPWMRKYIFPGGYTPALSEILSALQRSGLLVTDVEILRLHYAETLRHWRERFRANWDRMAELYDERFCRMWEFYLAGSEMAFRHNGLAVFQIQLAKRIDSVPMTRAYIEEREHEYASGFGVPERRRPAGRAA